MTTDRDRLTTFFYLLTRGHDERPGVGWGIVEDIIADCLPYESSHVCVRKGGEALAREMVDRLLGPAQTETTQASATGNVIPGELLFFGRELYDADGEDLVGVYTAQGATVAVVEVSPTAAAAWVGSPVSEGGYYGMDAPVSISRVTGSAGGSTSDVSDFGLTPDARRRAAMGELDAETIIAYDLERGQPASAEVHACIRAIADKPHHAPAAVSDLVRGQCETLRAAAEMLARVREWVMTPETAADINEMIDRCNLAAMGVGSDDSRAVAAYDPCAVLASHGWRNVGVGTNPGGVWQRGLNPPSIFIERGAVTLGRGPAVSPEELTAFAALARESQP